MNASRTLTIQLTISVGELVQALKAYHRDIDIQALPSNGSDVEITKAGQRNVVLTYVRAADTKTISAQATMAHFQTKGTELDPA